MDSMAYRLQYLRVLQEVGNALHQAADVAAVHNSVVKGGYNLSLFHGDEALHLIAPDRSFDDGTDAEDKALAR